MRVALVARDTSSQLRLNGSSRANDYAADASGVERRDGNTTAYVLQPLQEANDPPLVLERILQPFRNITPPPCSPIAPSALPNGSSLYSIFPRRPRGINCAMKSGCPVSNPMTNPFPLSAYSAYIRSESGTSVRQKLPSSSLTSALPLQILNRSFLMLRTEG